MKRSTTIHSARRFFPLAVIFWLLVWQAASQMIGEDILMVSPLTALGKLLEMMRDAAFYLAVLSSFGRILLGFILALSLGIALASLSSVSRFSKVLLHLPMAAISATPIASFVVLALVLIGSENLSVFISFLMALPVIYLSILKGVEQADEKLLQMTRVFRVGRRKTLGAVYIPALLPHLLSACQIALGMCWKSGLAAEVIGQPNASIGDALYRAKLFLATDELFAWTIAIILISVCFEKMALWGIRRLLRFLEGGASVRTR